jgi:NitT/TauT family transport system ATP-binding protein
VASSAAASARVVVENLRLSYQTITSETEAIRQVDFTVAPGEFVAIVGPSGCGKSTLLSLVAGLIRPTAGRVLVDGEEVCGTSTKMGYMLQQDYLFEWRTILSNCLLGPEVRGGDRATAARVATDLLTQYGLGDFLRHYPRHLSGGMRQRAALVRTLVTRPEVLLLDEPFSALDYQTRLTVANDIGSILRREGQTVILVTHDISEAVSLADRVLVMSRRPATIKSEHRITFAAPDLTPKTRRAQPEFRQHFNAIWEELDINVG